MNFGSAPLLELSWSSVISGGGQNVLQIDRLTYLKFNLSEDNIIQSALLRLYVTKAVTNSSIIIAVPEKNTAWTETNIAGKNAPDIPSTRQKIEDRAVDSVKITELNTWLSLNITSYARSVRSGLLSLILIGGNQESPYRDIVQFHSKESEDPALRPYLEVTYSGTEISGGGEGGGAGQKLVYLTLRSSIGGGSVYFNGTEYEVPNTLEGILDVPTGLCEIGASPTISISDTDKAVFQKWNDNSPTNPRNVQIGESMTLEAEYLEQYYLNVTTQYGAANGAGWYEKGSTATLGVSGDTNANPPKVQAEGILGLLGVRYVFDHWSGYSTDGPSLKINVDGPETVTAIWREDYSLFYSYLIRAISFGAGFVGAVVVGRRLVGARRRVGMSDQLRADTAPRRRSPLFVRQRDTAPPLVSRRDVAPAAPTKTLSPIRGKEPVRAHISVNPATSTRIGESAGSAGSSTGVIGRRQSVRENTGEPVRTVASTTAIPAARVVGMTKFCRGCGVKIPRDSKYCEECGKRLA